MFIKAPEGIKYIEPTVTFYVARYYDQEVLEIYSESQYRDKQSIIETTADRVNTLKGKQLIDFIFSRAFDR